MTNFHYDAANFVKWDMHGESSREGRVQDEGKQRRVAGYHRKCINVICVPDADLVLCS